MDAQKGIDEGVNENHQTMDFLSYWLPLLNLFLLETLSDKLW